MKTIYFVRHAKSSWDDHSLADHDRPLNDRGKRDAPVMARRLLGMDVVPDGLLSSSAKRTRQTAKYFKDVLSVDNAIYLRRLYHADAATIAQNLRMLPPEWDTVLAFGHNPGYTELANRLAHDEYIDNVPTCGIVVARAPIDDWTDFRLAEARRVAFYYPKQTK